MSQTPMERQYTALKNEAKDALLFFRVGDFYEMFHEDAVVASEVLDIALTSRNKNAENPVPMCGVPIKAADRYIAKLTAAGLKVAIAEQVSDPSLPGIVERKIISIITPGTTLSDQILEEKKNRFIASFVHDASGFSFARCDLSTGEVAMAQMQDFDELIRMVLSPDIVEIIFTPQNFSELSSRFLYFSGALSRHFPPESSEAFLLSFFGIKTLKSFGIEKNQGLQKAVALLFSYLEETQKTSLSHISDIVFLDAGQCVRLDPSTLTNLEIFSGIDGTVSSGLLAHIDGTKTAMGSRMIREWCLYPLADKSLIDTRLDMIGAVLEDLDLRTALHHAFAKVSDIERIVGKLAMQKATPSDMLRLSASLEAMQSILPVLQNIPADHPWGKWAKEVLEMF